MRDGRGLWRRWRLGLPTLLGRPRGFFIPYRYAAASRPPALYPGLDAAFTAATPEFRRRVAAIARYASTLAGFHGPPPAPRFGQDWFPRFDAAMAYVLVREERPARIVEIGSGHSTRFIARAIADGGLSTRLVAIDPAPRAALGSLTVEWIRSPVQAVDAAVFRDLGAGDILFVDSSHVLMPGTDVDFILNLVLPGLPPSVMVHFHDICLPDRYPDAWAWRGYNEQNAIAPLLIGGRWRILWSSRWVTTRMPVEASAAGLDPLPLPPGAIESSLWLEKA